MDLKKYGFTPEMMRETENISNESGIMAQSQNLWDLGFLT